MVVNERSLQPGRLGLRLAAFPALTSSDSISALTRRVPAIFLEKQGRCKPNMAYLGNIIYILWAIPNMI